MSADFFAVAEFAHDAVFAGGHAGEEAADGVDVGFEDESAARCREDGDDEDGDEREFFEHNYMSK